MELVELFNSQVGLRVWAS